jgi:hypothetical protein
MKEKQKEKENERTAERMRDRETDRKRGLINNTTSLVRPILQTATENSKSSSFLIIEI